MRDMPFLLLAVLALSAAAPAFRDCRDCPEMLPLLAGHFNMGSPVDEPGREAAEGPVTPVEVAAFAIGKYPVTRAQWAAFVAATGRRDGIGCEWSGPNKAGNSNASWRRLGFDQADDHPVVCISWNEAQAYVAWLSRRTGRHYRLPAEAEWEYAARAGTTTAYPWGSEADHDQANYGADKCCSPAMKGRDRWLYTAPVGSFAANSFGIHDMVGSVWQWTADCWSPSLAGRPAKAVSVTAKDCAAHVARGGTWGDTGAMIRIAMRNYAPPPWQPDPAYRSGGFGLRVVANLRSGNAR